MDLRCELEIRIHQGEQGIMLLEKKFCIAFAKKYNIIWKEFASAINSLHETPPLMTIATYETLAEVNTISNKQLLLWMLKPIPFEIFNPSTTTPD